MLDIVDTLELLNQNPGEWWIKYVKLGCFFVSENIQSMRIALVVPSRVYVTGFICMGYALASIANKASKHNYDAHYSYLASLDNGAALYYFDPRKKSPGKAELLRKEQELWAIDHRKTANPKKPGDVICARKMITRENCYQYGKADVDHWGSNIINRNHRVVNAFLSKIIVDKELYNRFMAVKNTNICLVGVIKQLRDEIDEPVFSFAKCNGAISDFLKTKSATSSVNIVSQRSKSVHVEADLTVFDSVSSYLDFRNVDTGSPCCELVVFDRADKSFHEGVACWNNEYKSVDVGKFDKLELPRGVVLAVSGR